MLTPVGRRRSGAGVPLGFLYDAWVLFTLLLPLAGTVVLLWPARLIDWVLGTRVLPRLVRFAEWVGDL